MAHAVKELFGQKVQVTIGPAIENGFYYDFYSPRSHLHAPRSSSGSRRRWRSLAAADLPIERQEMISDEAISSLRGDGRRATRSS